jgi:hypothetical protein
MANTYITKTFGSAGNRKTWTMSAWIKRTQLASSSDIRVFGWKSGGGNYGFQFDSDKFRFYLVDGGSGAEFLTNRLFRDTNAWYHIVVSCDTTQNTASDRFKLYVNGVQETSFGTATYPNLNEDTAVNKAEICRLGCSVVAENSFFDGLISHAHFIDGTAYPASTFGSTDSTTGIWKIKTAPSVTYGTNGFFLLKDGNNLSGSTVSDQSGRGNDFTVGGGTLTNLKDNPSNIFASLNTLKILGTTNRNISNNNTKFYTGTTHWGTMLSTLAFSSGKYYCEVKLDTIQASAGYGALGITDATENYQSNDNIQQQSSFSAGCVTDHRSGQSACKSAASTVSSNIGNFSNGDIVGIAADMDNKALYLHKNGTYLQIGGVTGVPTSGASKTGAITIPATCVDCMFSVSSYTSDATSSINFGNGYFGTTAVTSAENPDDGIGIFEYDVPAGYKALTTKGLNS